MISLIHPSRGRAQKAYETAKKWIESAGVPVEYILSLDDSDDVEGYRRVFSSNWMLDPNNEKAPKKLIVNPNDCVVQATNHAAKAATGDVLIYLSDDFDCFPNWGIKIEEICAKYSGEYMIKVDDGLQKFHNQVLTVPIMSRPLYERLGYFFHPDYKSMWVDVDLYYTTVNYIKLHPEITFQHNHYSNGKAKKDDTYTRSDGFWDQGKAVLARRKAQRFR